MGPMCQPCEWNADDGGSEGGVAGCVPSFYYLKCMSFNPSNCTADEECQWSGPMGPMCQPTESLITECAGGNTSDGCDALSNCQWDEGNGGGGGDGDAARCGVSLQISMSCAASADCLADSKCAVFGNMCVASPALSSECDPMSGDLAREDCENVENCEWHEGGGGSGGSGGGESECLPSDSIQMMCAVSANCIESDCVEFSIDGNVMCVVAGSIGMECNGGLSGSKTTRDGCDDLPKCQWDEGNGGGGGDGDAARCGVSLQISMSCAASADCLADSMCAVFGNMCVASPALSSACDPMSGDLAREDCENVENCEWHEGGGDSG